MITNYLIHRSLGKGKDSRRDLWNSTSYKARYAPWSRYNTLKALGSPFVPMINPSFLKTFVTLVETRSFTRTATRLGMTQPGVSQHLRWLEEYFGATLIERR